jgi:hypothetical protein
METPTLFRVGNDCPDRIGVRPGERYKIYDE